MSSRPFYVTQLAILTSLVNSRVIEASDLPTANLQKTKIKFENREHGHDKHATNQDLDFNESHNKVEHYIMSEKRKRSHRVGGNNFNFGKLPWRIQPIEHINIKVERRFLKLLKDMVDDLADNNSKIVLAVFEHRLI